MKSNNNQPVRISNAYLQRKYKFSYEMAKEICELAGNPTTQTEWIECNNDLPKHNEIIIVYGRPILIAIQSFQKCLATFNVNCGWIKHEEGILLYVTHWQATPKDPTEEINHVDELDGYYGPPR